MGWQDGTPIQQTSAPSVKPVWMSGTPVDNTDKIEAKRSAGDDTLKSVALGAAGSVPGVPVLENAVSGLTGGLGQFLDAVTGSVPGTHNFAYQPRTPQGQEMQAGLGGAMNAAVTGASKLGGAAVGAAGGNAPAAEQTLQERIPEALGAIGTVLPAGGLIKGGLGAIAEGAATRASAAPPVPAAVTNLGMRTGEGQAIARNIAGESALPAVVSHNQGIADAQLRAQVGAPAPTVDKPTLVQNLEDAKDVPNAVYKRAATNLPTANLSPAATQMVQNVGANDLIVHSPNTQAMIEAQKARLLAGPLSGEDAVNAQRTLRYNGFKNQGLDDPENRALGSAQLKLSDALHQHMVDTLPPNADVSIDQLTKARQSLAQINTLQNAAKGNNVDLQQLAKVHRDNPGLLTGPMADIAQFADLHPEVTSLPGKGERFNPSGVAKDVASIDLKKPLTYVQPIFGAAARGALTGPPVRAPTSGLAADLAPIDRTPQPPPGLTASTPQAPSPAAAGPPGQIPLADVLAHGVEQGPTQGLSAGPMGAPAGQGVPFRPNLEHAAGGLTLDESLNGPRGAAPNNSDLAPVMSQGVPEGTMMRSAPSSAPLFRKLGQQPIPKQRGSFSLRDVNNASGQTPVSEEFANAQDADRAGGVTRSLVDLDGRGTSLSGVAARDVGIQGSTAGARVGSGIAIEERPGETPRVINRGNLSQSAANGLLARHLAMRGGLASEF